MTEQPSLAVFCDFDGTVAVRDVGYHLFHHFSGGRNDELLPDWKAGRISSREILTREAAMVHATPEAILAHVDEYQLDAAFAAFETLCRANDVPVTVISEGLDIYIKRLLYRHGLEHVPVICNIGHLEAGGLRIEFPYVNRVCTSCGSCKGERIAEYRQRLGRRVTVVFVGDGYSDACAAAEADILFAKKDLEQYCLARNIRYNSYKTFADVARSLTELGHLCG
jgi:2,3-diketo-5-methylthio-1-phosphopentane phosphatase